MTTQTTLNTYSFRSRVNSTGTAGNSSKIEFEWKLPVTKFPFILYYKASDHPHLDDVGAGDTLDVEIERGTLKDGKDGR